MWIRSDSPTIWNLEFPRSNPSAPLIQRLHNNKRCRFIRCNDPGSFHYPTRTPATNERGIFVSSPEATSSLAPVINQFLAGHRYDGFLSLLFRFSNFPIAGFLLIVVEAFRGFDMEAKQMCAVQYESYGGGAAGLKHVKVPVPTPNKGEILLKVEATSLNPVDWKIQQGMIRPLYPKKFPCIPATDIAGEVVGVGPGVKNFKPGDKVVSLLSHSTGGGLAEYAVAKENLTVPRPPEVSAAEGASLPVAGLTAYQALTKSAGLKLDGTGPQKNILVTAASGGVGHFTIQLAKLGNVHVTATCGARNIDFVRSLGADEVLDYKTLEGASLKSPSGKKYDAVVQCAPAIAWSVFEPNLSSNGKVIDITPGASTMWTFAVKKVTMSKKQLVPLLMSGNGKDLGVLLELVNEGKLKVVVDSKYPLSRAEEAWAKSMDGHATGKVVVEL